MTGRFRSQHNLGASNSAVSGAAAEGLRNRAAFCVNPAVEGRLKVLASHVRHPAAFKTGCGALDLAQAPPLRDSSFHSRA